MLTATGCTILLCVKNEGYPRSLEVRKVYQSLTRSGRGFRGGFVRIIDDRVKTTLSIRVFRGGRSIGSRVARVCERRRLTEHGAAGGTSGQATSAPESDSWRQAVGCECAQQNG